MKSKDKKTLVSFLVYLRESQYIAPDDPRTDSDILDSYDMYRAYHPDVPAAPVGVTAAQINQQAIGNVSAVRLENLETRVDVWGQRISQLITDVQEIQKFLVPLDNAQSNAPWPQTHTWLVPVDFTETEETN